MKHNKQYIIVAWDLDETIGNFVEIGVLCDALKSMVGRDLTSLEFYNILDLISLKKKIQLKNKKNNI